MSNYTLAVGWSGKDALSDSDAAKVISGADFNTEFSAVQTAVNTKADINGTASETFSATTAAVGTNTTQVATTQFVTAAVTASVPSAYPVGAVFTTVSDYADSDAVVADMGGTTWVAFAAGKMLIGVDSTDSTMDVAEDTAGSKDAVLKTHDHFIIKDDGSSGSGGGYTTTVTATNTLDTVAWAADSDTSYALKGVTGQVADRGLTSEAGTSDGTNANLPPYIAVYMWKRTA